MSEDIDINATLELSHNLTDAARTTMQAAHKLKELAEALQQATHGGWLPASVLPPVGELVLGISLCAQPPLAGYLKRRLGDWRDQYGRQVAAPDFWCHLPKGVMW